ncbi:MAG: hypothetical protein U5L96_04300 [Owenweeksia sp.]|nr:hypothetical protein [Owenweeksia sp.]
MTILILEDEMRAPDRLVKMVKELRPKAEISTPLDSIEDSLNWLRENPDPDIVLMDIELADGRSFEIFSHHNLSSKVIFCTAFDQYALDRRPSNTME